MRIYRTRVIKMLGDIYHLETTDFNRWVINYLDLHLSSFQKHHIIHHYM
jgi:hypothetical protein